MSTICVATEFTVSTDLAEPAATTSSPFMSVTIADEALADAAEPDADALADAALDEPADCEQPASANTNSAAAITAANPFFAVNLISPPIVP